MASQLLPMFAKLIKEKKKEEIRHLAQTGFRIIMFISISLSVGIASFGEEIINLALSEEEYPSAYVGLILSLLILSFIPIASSYVFNTLMNANASLRMLNIIGVIGVLINIILNFILIPQYGALGAVYATLFTQSLAGLGHVYFANKILDLRMPISLFLKVLAFGLLMYLVIRCEEAFVSVNWMIRFIASGIIALPIGWLLGLLDMNMVKEIFERKGRD